MTVAEQCPSWCSRMVQTPERSRRCFWRESCMAVTHFNVSHLTRPMCFIIRIKTNKIKANCLQKHNETVCQDIVNNRAIVYQSFSYSDVFVNPLEKRCNRWLKPLIEYKLIRRVCLNALVHCFHCAPMLASTTSTNGAPKLLTVATTQFV